MAGNDFRPFFPSGTPRYVRADRQAANSAAQQASIMAALSQMNELYGRYQAQQQENEDLDAFNALGLGRQLQGAPDYQMQPIQPATGLASQIGEVGRAIRSGGQPMTQQLMPATPGAQPKPGALPEPEPYPVDERFEIPDGVTIDEEMPVSVPFTPKQEPMMSRPTEGVRPTADQTLAMRRAEVRVLQKHAPQLTQLQVIKESGKGRKEVADARISADREKLILREGRKMADLAEKEAIQIRKENRQLANKLRGGVSTSDFKAVQKFAADAEAAAARAETNYARLADVLETDDPMLASMEERVKDLRQMAAARQFILNQLSERMGKQLNLPKK